jgi:hypothetical protein
MSFLSRTNEGKPDSRGIDLIQGFNETLRWVYIDEHFRRLQGHRINAVNYRNVQTNIKCSCYNKNKFVTAELFTK